MECVNKWAHIMIEMHGNFVTLALSSSLMFRMCSRPMAPVPMIAKRRTSVAIIEVINYPLVGDS